MNTNLHKSPLLADDLPEGTHERRAIVVLTDDDVYRAVSEGKGKFLVTSDQTCFLRYQPELNAVASTTLHKLRRRNLYARGVNVILNPFEVDAYMPYDGASKEATQSKVLAFTAFCGLLGATEVSITNAKFKGMDVEVSASFAGGTPKLKNLGKIELEKSSSFAFIKSCTEMLKVHQTCSASNPSLEEAEKYMHQSGLYDDSLINQLFTLRSSSKSSKMQSTSLELTTTSEVNGSFQNMANLRIPEWLRLKYDLKAGAGRFFETTLETKITFNELSK